MTLEKIEFNNPPPALFMKGSKTQTDVGGSRVFVSIDENHNFYNEGDIFNELSWAIFDEEVDDQIEFIYPQKYESCREDPDALIKRITTTLYNIINQGRLYYGIIDFEVDAFMNMNPMSLLKKDPDEDDDIELGDDLLNILNETHKENREKDEFSSIVNKVKDLNKLDLYFEGSGAINLQYPGPNLEDYGEKLRLAKGYAIGVVCISEDGIIFYIISENVVFSEEEIQEHRIDHDNLKQIKKDITKKKLFSRNKVLFPISWFRIDIGLRSFETLDLYGEINDNADLEKAFNYYDRYISGLIYKKYKPEEITGTLTMEKFLKLSPRQRTKIFRDLIGALRELKRMYYE